MATRAELIVKYNAMRDSYMKAGNLFEQAMQLFEKGLQKMEEVKVELKNGWGY